MRFLAGVITGLLLASWCAGDVIITTDGARIEGKIHKTADGWSVTQPDGSVVTVTADKIASMQASSTADPAAVARDRLQSLRRAASYSTDVTDIITRYKNFISQVGVPEVAADAEKDLAVWQDRADRSLVKLGDDWITPQEREQRRDVAQKEALPAKELIANYRFSEAQKILQQAITDDPQCATALYLQGLLLYRQDQVDQAKKSFQEVDKIIPGHPPTLNNLAVIAWRQKSFVVAMNYYDLAMMAAPEAKEILDNVAEALNVIPPENQEAPVVVKGIRLFAEQDAILQKIAAQQGMYRWGATWVNAKQLAELRAEEARIKQQLAGLQSQLDALQQSIAQIDSEIGANQREMDRLQAQSIVIDRNGDQIQLPLPQQYYQLQRDSASLTAQKAPLLSQEADIHGRMKEVESQLPVPKFTGVQKIIGVEGTPVWEQSATQPAS